MSSMLCAQCGSLNNATSVVCQNCGAGLLEEKSSSSRVDKIINGTGPLTEQPRNYAPPAPQWTNPPAMPAPAVYIPPPPIGYRCPFCQSPHPPFVAQKVSTAGWVTFVVLLLFCIPLCWIGLLMKENYHVCSTCGMAFG